MVSGATAAREVSRRSRLIAGIALRWHAWPQSDLPHATTVNGFHARSVRTERNFITGLRHALEFTRYVAADGLHIADFDVVNIQFVNKGVDGIKARYPVRLTILP